MLGLVGIDRQVGYEPNQTGCESSEFGYESTSNLKSSVRTKQRDTIDIYFYHISYATYRHHMMLAWAVR